MVLTTKQKISLASCAGALAFLAICRSAVGDDWPQWQGPDRNAVSADTGLLQEWPAEGPALAWRVDGLGGGDSAPAVADGKLFGLSNRDGKEIVWALSEADGKELWDTSLGDAVDQRMPQSKEGPGGTPTVDGDRLYAIGMGGRIVCLSIGDGQVIWQRNMVDDFSGTLPAWSYRESPLIDGDKLICTPGSPTATLVALDKRTGETIWSSQLPPSEEKTDAAPQQRAGDRSERIRGERPNADQDSPRSGRRRRGPGRGRGGMPRSGAAYSSAIAIDVDGQRQYVQLTANSLIGVAADDGSFLWRYDRPANPMGINCSTPIYQDGMVFAASAYGTGGGAVKLTKDASGKFQADEIYFTSSMQNHHGGMIVIDGALYGANGGNGGGFLACLDFQTGEILWRDRKAPKGALLMADKRLYLRSEEGTMVLIEPSREKFVERGRFEQPDRSEAPAWAHPVIANGKLYIRDQGLLLCYDVQQQ
ncbi:MAG: PQQ-binding-like beta-propeller repeat protein [Planctomycetales bacterium]|nr:PQQ-binding-like beta-propeller repeat protein [Planctomycetales bacterium]